MVFKIGGYLKIVKQKGTGQHREVIDFGRIIGKYYNKTTGKFTLTTKGTIHYDSNGNFHVVPASP